MVKLIIAFILLAIMMNGCGFNELALVDTTSCEGSDCDKSDDPPATDEKKFFSGVAQLRNSESMLASFSVVTTVPRTNNTVKNAFDDVKNALPLDGSILNLSAPSFLALISLASQFCGVRRAEEDNFGQDVEDERRTLFRGVNFRSGLTGFTTEVRIRFLQDIAKRAWGRPMKDSELAMFLDEMQKAAALEENPNSTDATDRLAIMGCTAILVAPSSITG